MNRRGFLRSGLLAAGAVLGAPMINCNSYRLFAGTDGEYSGRVIDVVSQSVVIDMLGLLTLDWKRLDSWQSDPSTFTEENLAAIRSSGIDIFHPAVELNDDDPHEATKRCFRRWNFFLDSRNRSFLRVDNAADLARAKSEGKIGIILGSQNGDHFRTTADVELFYSMGQRVSQLTYNSNNSLGGGCTERRDSGLTAFGAEIIRQMNALGMAVDVSHSGDRTTLDAFACSRKPVLITHSNCRALVPRHPRCKSDEVIKKIAATGSVMGITGIRAFVSPRESADLSDLLDHFDHVVRVAGIECVGIGSDRPADASAGLPGTRNGADVIGLGHPKRVYDIARGLIGRGYSDSDIQLILGGNFIRVLGRIWAA